jgi:hypothetical protein
MNGCTNGADKRKILGEEFIKKQTLDMRQQIE